MCIPILYKFQGQEKKRMKVIWEQLPSKQQERKHVPWPVTVDALWKSDTHDDLTPDTELYSRAVG
jgi:hypothetical protein